MKITPAFVAVAAALLLAAVVAYIVRPAQLTVHAAAEPTMTRTAGPTAAPPVRARMRPLVYVAGAVLHPGVYDVPDDARARDAIAMAGGASADADLVAVNLAAHIADGDEIAVPHRGEVPVRAARAAAHQRVRGAAAHHRRRRHRTPPIAERVVDDAQPALAARVDVNSADADTLAELPGIGPVLAERIVDFRMLNGPFTSVDGLADVAGITPQRLDALEELVTAGR